MFSQRLTYLNGRPHGNTYGKWKTNTSHFDGYDKYVTRTYTYQACVKWVMKVSIINNFPQSVEFIKTAPLN